jgi:hypothetical protein
MLSGSLTQVQGWQAQRQSWQRQQQWRQQNAWLEEHRGEQDVGANKIVEAKRTECMKGGRRRRWRVCARILWLIYVQTHGKHGL